MNREGFDDICKMISRSFSLKSQPHHWALAVLLLASPTIVVALLLVHFIPWRFRIHPLPYLSDAGLRDPERVILSFGLALAAVSFIPVAIGLRFSHETQLQIARRSGHAAIRLNLISRLRFPFKRNFLRIQNAIQCDLIPRIGMNLGFMLSFFLALFSAIPGWFFLHHVFAALFALTAASWCLCHTLVSHATSTSKSTSSVYLGEKRLVLLYALVVIQFLVVSAFGAVWLSIKLHIPYKMIPNKDFRFVILACLEYIGASSFLIFIGMVGRELKQQGTRLRITMETLEDIDAIEAFRGK
eukprot:GFKZ01003760.1.p1 GENE.GFKZ01003760.1~~GFKZ01003760.1.p1  ORF type:complete len:299 (+),score=12.80 GFKZ01003760.1:49-945(+)